MLFYTEYPAAPGWPQWLSGLVSVCARTRARKCQGQVVSRHDDYWRRHQARGQSGGGAVTEMPKAAQFVQANAESLPFAAGSFDGVVCVDLFHESLPASSK